METWRAKKGEGSNQAEIKILRSLILREKSLSIFWKKDKACGGTFGPKRSWHFIALKNFISITDPDSHPFFARTFPSKNLSAQQSKRGLRKGLTFGCTLRRMKISISSPKDEDHLKQIRPVAERERRGWVG